MSNAQDHETGVKGTSDPDQLNCRRCLEPRNIDNLDTMFWCRDCQERERRRAAWWGRVGALAASVGFILWIRYGVNPSDRFLIFWAAAVVVAYRLCGRLGQELAYGWMRIRNRPGVRAEEAGAAKEGA